MDPRVSTLINRRLETIVNQMEGVTGVEEKAKPYLLHQHKVATAVVHGAILNTQYKDRLRKRWLDSAIHRQHRSLQRGLAGFAE